MNQQVKVHWINTRWLWISILLGLLFGYILHDLKETNATSVFYSASDSVVELKSSSKLHADNYGTAVFIDDDGMLITNSHVVLYKKNHEYWQYDDYFIRLASENNYHEVSLLKYDTNLDIAVLKLDKNDAEYKSILIGNSEDVDFGDDVYAIGNALNYGISIEKGIVSIPRIKLEYDNIIRDVIQCDLNITPGNSGGALLDKNGKLIGITSFRTKDVNGNVVYGMAYAVPIQIIIEYIHM